MRVVAVIGNKQSESGGNDYLQRGKEVNVPEGAVAREAEHEAGNYQAGRKYEKRYQPIGDEFAEYERASFYRCNVYLLDCALFFFSYYVKCGEKAGYHSYGYYYQCGNHEYFVIHVGVVIVFRGYFDFCRACFA